MADQSSRPHASPARTARRTERRIVKLRITARLGPARIGFRLGLAPSTVLAVLARYGCPRLRTRTARSGVPVRRDERDRPAELVHVDVKKLGNIPAGTEGQVIPMMSAQTCWTRRDEHLGIAAALEWMIWRPRLWRRSTKISTAFDALLMDKQYQPDEQARHREVDEVDEYERRGQKSRSADLPEFCHLTGLGIDISRTTVAAWW